MAASTASNLLPCLFLIITHKGNRFQVVPGQKVIIPRAHLLTTRKRAEVLPDGSRALSEGDAPAGHVLLVAPKLGAVKGPASVLPASVLYGGQEGLKPLSFKMCAFQGEKPLTNRLLIYNAVAVPLQLVVTT